MDSIPMATPVETSMATSVATPVKIDEDETIDETIDYENFAGFNLLPRQDLAYHRFTQYCTDEKGFLLLHNVGSGKTITSLNMALTILSKYTEQQKPLKIVVVLPTGLFDNFIKELKGKINGVGNIEQVLNIPPSPLKVDKVFSFTYLNRKYEISEVLYKFINQRPTNQDIYKVFSEYIKDSVVIFDEVHRLLRPIPGNINAPLCKDMLDPQYAPPGGVMKNCIKYITMTGTPLNKSINDIKVLMHFISGNEKYEDIDGNEYSMLGSKGLQIAKYTEIQFFIKTSVLVIIVAILSFGETQLKTLGPNANLSLGIIITLILSLITKIGGDNSLIGMPENKMIDYINSQVENYLKTKNSQIVISSLREIGKSINVNEILTFSGISNNELLEITKIYLSIYSMLLTSNNNIDINKVKFLSNFFYNYKNDIIGISNTFLKGGSLNSSSMLQTSQIVLSNLLPKIVFQEGGKGKKNMKGGQLELILNGFSEPINKLAFGLANIPLGFRDAVKDSPLNPSYTFCQNINSWFNVGLPFDIKKYSIDVKKFISISDSSIQGGLVGSTYNSIYTVDGFKKIIEKQSTLGPTELENSSNYLKETPEFYKNVEKGPIKSNYPKKLECCLEMDYQDNQVNFFRKFDSDSLKKSTKEKIFGSDFNIISASKIVGNYSDDILRFKCSYDTTEGKYKYLNLSDKQEVITKLPEWTFGCSKFNNILINLLFMRSGYMKVYKEIYKSQNYIVSQPHFTNKIVTEDKIDEGAQIPNLLKLEDGREAPYVVTDDAATCYYLPIVYSTSDNLGLGLFAGFLDSLGFNYILIHDLDKKNGDNQKLRSYMPVSMGQEKFKIRPDNKNTNVEDRFEEILQNIKNKNLDSYDKTQPICILLHNAMTEGIDFKFNPGIFLLEVPNTYGDYDQLSGRVLRTYSNRYNINWKTFTDDANFEFIKRWRLPIKVIYQVVCLTGIDRIKLLNEKIGPDNPNATTDENESQSQIRTSSYKAPTISNSSVLGSQALLNLNNESLAAKVYNTCSYSFSNFTSPDLRQWYELLTQKTLFKQFITVLNISEDKPEFTGLTDLQAIINCVPEAKAVILEEPMCKVVPSGLNEEEYNKIYQKLYLNPENDSLQKFKTEYCIGEQIKLTDKVSTIIKNLNPTYINRKKLIEKETQQCLEQNKTNENAKKQCKTTEATKLKTAWKEIKSTIPKPIQESTRHSTRQRGVQPENSGLGGGKRTIKKIKGNRKTRKYLSSKKLRKTIKKRKNIKRRRITNRNK